MNKFFANTFCLVLLICGTISLKAQDNATDAHEVNIKIPEVAILDIESTSSTSFTLAPEKPTEAGLALDFSEAKNTDLWLNYSSIVGSTTQSERTIDVKIQDGSTVPEGLVLKVSAAADEGNGDGEMGTPVGEITLSNTAQDFIKGIGSCYTGSPAKNGHQLTYLLELNSADGSYGKIDFDESTSLKIVYTITE